MARAGYDPNEAVTFWERMSENNGGGKVPQYASTQPSDSTRIAQLRELMPKAMAEYNRAAATVPQRN